MNEIVELADGTPVGTGLIVPDERPTGVFASFPTAKELSDETIRTMLAKPGRTPRAERFGDNLTWNQGNVGSCAPYAAYGAVARAMVMRGYPVIELGPEFGYSLINGGRDQGSQLVDTMKTIEEVGCPRREFVPQFTYRKRDMPQEAYDDAPNHRALEPYEVEDLQQLRSGLAQGFVGVVAMHFGRASSQFDDNWIPGVIEGPGNHAVLVEDVEWIEGIGWVYPSRNSHTKRYGNNGRMKLTAAHFRYTLPRHVFYLIRSTYDIPYITWPMRG